MAIFASLNPHISSVGQPTSTKFATLVQPFSIHFRAKARRNRSDHFCGINDEMHGECAKNWHPRRVWRRLAPKLRFRPLFFILDFGEGEILLKLCKISDNPVKPIFCKRRITNIMLGRRQMTTFASLNTRISGRG